MIDFPYLSGLIRRNETKIVMVVVDGLGGIPDPVYGRSELEAARIPNLDNLARRSAGGLVQHFLPGITVGSGVGHLALFGYDPLSYAVGRGALEAAGVGLDLKEGDIAARGNFATVDEHGVITDRRAGRIDSEMGKRLSELLNEAAVDGVAIDVRHVEGYRFALRVRGSGLSPDLTDTDPQATGVPLPPVEARSKEAERAAWAVNEFVRQARELLAEAGPANAIMLRGWAGPPSLPPFGERYGLKAAAIATYPMYRGVARVTGMTVLDAGDSLRSQVDTLREHWDEYDFFYLHYKEADLAGESGSFAAKKQALEALDDYITDITALNPDVLIVTGDHATPSSMKGHSWHPVPVILQSQWTVGDGIHRFNEREARSGSLGLLDAKHLMLLALGHAGRLLRYGA